MDTSPASGTQTTVCPVVRIVKLINTLTLLVLLVVILQLPVTFYFGENIHRPLFIGMFIATVLLGLVVQLNQRGRVRIARWVLILTFTGYICLSTYFWRLDINTHYFLLFGFLVFAHIFQAHEWLQYWIANGLYLLSFLLLSTWYEPSDLSSSLDLLVWLNDIFLAMSAILCSFYVRMNTHGYISRLTRAQQSAEAILSNTLPPDIVDVLKKPLSPRLRKHPHLSVIFADISGFTGVCYTQTTEQTVALLDTLYGEFDQIVSECGLKKIKTNGDQYIAVAGLSTESSVPESNACRCALRLMARFHQYHGLMTRGVGLRIGLATGDVISGVIGKHTFCFDIWGDAVNTAARLEQKTAKNSIMVCENTRKHLDTGFCFSRRKTMEDKQGNPIGCHLLTEQTHYETESDI